MKKLTKKKIISLTKIAQPFLMVDSLKKIKSLKSATGFKKSQEIHGFLNVISSINQ